MKDHISDELLNGYVRSSLTPDDLLTVDEHLSICDECRSNLVSIVPTGSDATALIRSLDPEPFTNHLEYDEMAAYVDDQLDGIALEIVELHLSDCSSCRDEADTLRDLFVDGAGPRHIPAAPSLGERFWSLVSIPTVRYGVSGVLILGLSVFVYYLTRPRDPIGQDQVSIEVESQNAIRPTETAIETPNDAPVSIIEETEKPAITIIDGNRSLKVGSDGKLIDPFAGEYDIRIENALRSGNLSIAPEIGRLRSASGPLMGPQGDKSGLRVTSPFGKVVVSDRPNFSWLPILGAESYRVEVFDASFSKVAESPTIKTNKWQPAARLARGREYSWQVTAVKGDETFKAPTRPAPDASFFILSSEKLGAIERAKRTYGRSGIVMGLAYADAGLLDDAEREFAAVLKRNPASEPVRRLLAKVRSAQ